MPKIAIQNKLCELSPIYIKSEKEKKLMNSSKVSMH